MNIDQWTPQGFMPDLSDSGPLPPGERERLRENIERASRPAEYQIEELFSEPDMEMLRFKADQKKWISAGYGILRILRHSNTMTGTITKSLVLEQFVGSKPILNRKISHETKITPYPVKNAIEVTFIDDILAFRKGTPLNREDIENANLASASGNSDDLYVVSDMMKQLKLSDEMGQIQAAEEPRTPPTNAHVKSAVAWKLLETLRDRTDALQTSFRGVLYAFRATNIVLWRFKENGEAGSRWLQFGDGELTIASASNRWIIKWTRRYDQKVMVHAILEPQNTQYMLGAAPLTRGVLFSIVRSSQDGESWNVMFQCRGSKSVQQTYSERQQMENAIDDDFSDEETTANEDVMVTDSEPTSVAGDNETVKSLEASIELPDSEYRRMIHWALLKALARTPARPKRLGSISKPKTSSSTSAMDTS